jgi:hypothetical protein
VDETLNSGLAEEVDGLAGISDQEEGLGVCVPVAGEELDEVVLASGGVLHLVDEEVLEAGAEGAGEVVGAGVGAEGGAGEEGQLGEVALVAEGEDELEFDQGAAEDTEERFGDGPLVGWVVGGGKGADAVEKVEEVGVAGEGVDESDEAGVKVRFSIVVKL